MYKTFEEAKAAAISVIEKLFNGEKMDCVVTESKLSKMARNVFYGFRFHDTDTHGEFVMLEDGTFQKRTAI